MYGVEDPLAILGRDPIGGRIIGDFEQLISTLLVAEPSCDCVLIAKLAVVSRPPSHAALIRHSLIAADARERIAIRQSLKYLGP
jgi:hypothetical protein